MPTLVIVKDPLQSTSERVIIPLADGMTLIDVLERHFSPGFGGVETDVRINGRMIDKEDDAAHARPLKGDDIVSVIHQPSGVELAIAAVIAVVAAVAVVALMPTPVVPNNQGQASDSPNNNLSGQTNLARPYQAIPEIHGSIVSYPDLVQPAVYQYVNDVKRVNELFCIGVGEYEVGDVRTEKSLIEKVSGSDYSIYPPGQAPSDLMIAESTAEVDGQELIPSVADTTYNEAPIIAKPIGFDYEGNQDGSDYAAFAILDTDIIEDAYIDLVSSFDITDAGLADGTYNFTSYSKILIGDVAAVEFLGVSVSSYVSDELAAIYTVPPEGLIWVGWFQLPRISDEIWCHFQFPQGLRTEGGGSWYREWRVEVQETDSSGTPVGAIQSFDYYREDRSLDPLFETVKIDSITNGYYRVRATMLTPGPDKKINQDQMKWEDAQSIQYYSSSRFGEITLLEVDTKATEFASAQSSRKINADVTRKLPTWTPSGGYDATLTTSRKFADAVLYTLYTLGNVPLENIDLEELYEIQDDLDARNVELGRFDYSFDDEGISLGDRVATICNCVRVLPYREGQVWRFTREEAKEQAVAVFNRRNIASGENQSQLYQFRQPDEYDGVIVSYTDPDTDSLSEIYLTSNVDGTITEGESQNPNEFELAGCRSEVQARDRAEMEARRILYQRITVTDTVLTDGHYVNIGDRVRWVDIYDTAVGDGEIWSQDGDVYETSEYIDWQEGEDHYVVITDADGYPSAPVIATKVDDTHFRATISSSASIANWQDVQAGSRYVIGTADDTEATDFVVKSKTPQDTGLVELELINYDPRVYEEDA